MSWILGLTNNIYYSESLKGVLPEELVGQANRENFLLVSDKELEFEIIRISRDEDKLTMSVRVSNFSHSDFLDYDMGKIIISKKEYDCKFLECFSVNNSSSRDLNLLILEHN